MLHHHYYHGSLLPWLPQPHRLVGLVVRRPPQERKVPGSNPACAGIFSGSSHTSDLNIGTPVASLPGAWRYRVSAGTGRPGVSILWLGEMESFICSFYLSVAACKIVQIRPWDTLACCWDVKQPTNKPTSVTHSTLSNHILFCFGSYSAVHTLGSILVTYGSMSPVFVLPAILLVLCGKNFNVEHHFQRVQPPGILIGTVELYYFIPFSVALTLGEGHCITRM